MPTKYIDTYIYSYIDSYYDELFNRKIIHYEKIQLHPLETRKMSPCETTRNNCMSATCKKTS